VYFVFCCSGPDFDVPDELSGSVVVVLSVPLSIHVISLDLSVIFQSSVQVPPLFKVILGVFVMVILLGVVVIDVHELPVRVDCHCLVFRSQFHLNSLSTGHVNWFSVYELSQVVDGDILVTEQVLVSELLSDKSVEVTVSD
jgi:hypothetical protein